MGKSKQKTETQQQQTATVAPNAVYSPYIDQAAAGLKPAYDAAQANNASLMPRVNSVLDFYAGNLNADLQTNPYLGGIIDTTNRGVTDQVNSQFSAAGRYGSGAHTGVLADKLSSADNALRYQDFSTQQARQDALKSEAARGVLQGSTISAALPQAASSAYADSVRQLLGGYTTGNQNSTGTSTTTSSPSILQMLLAAGSKAGQAVAAGG